LDKSYEGLKNIYVHNNTLFISGTHSIKDVLTDLTIPFGMLGYTERFKQAELVLKKNENIDTIVSHSLGSAIAHKLADMGQIKTVRAYGSPTLYKHKKILHLRHYGDPVSVSTRWGDSNEINTMYAGNVHSYDGFKDYYN